MKFRDQSALHSISDTANFSGKVYWLGRLIDPEKQTEGITLWLELWELCAACLKERAAQEKQTLIQCFTRAVTLSTDWRSECADEYLIWQMEQNHVSILLDVIIWITLPLETYWPFL